MDILRRMGVGVALAVLALFLWTLAIDIGVVHFVANPDKVKQVLAKSGIYDNVVSTVLDQTDNNIQIGNDQVPGNDQLIKNAANQAFPPSLIQQDVNTVIDSVSNWLNGKTTQPDFKIDVSGPKNNFAKYLASGVQAQLASLPACTSTSAASIQEFNPFTSACLPKGVDPAVAANQVQSDVTNSSNFLPQSAYSASDIKSSDGKPIFQDQLNSGPSRYRNIKSSPYVLGAIALLAAMAAVMLSSSRRKGFRRVGVTLVLIGSIIMALTALLNSASNRVTTSVTPDIQNKALQDNVNNALKSFVHDLDHTYYTLGGTYVVLGLLAIILPMFILRGGQKPKRDEPEHNDHAPVKPVMHTPEDNKEPDEDEPSGPELAEPQSETEKPVKHTHTPTRRKINIS